MLGTLRVHDLAIIEELELTLEPGLNVLTGETGAGKSVLLQALDVALGGRPDADLVRTGAEEGWVEALFLGISAPAREALAAAGVPPHDHPDRLLVKRVVSRGGRTRAYVNGALGTLALLRELAPHLVRVYGQDEHQALRRVESHREMLDAAGGLGTTIDEMRQRYARLAAARDALARAQAERDATSERADILRGQVTELERASLVAGEEEALTAERARLLHAERLATLVGGAEGAIYSGEGAVVGVLGKARTALREAAGFDPALEATRTLVETALTELEEAGSVMGRYLGQLAPDPTRLEMIDDRLAVLVRLKRKYAGSVEDLINRRTALAAELAQQGGPAAALDELESALEAARRAASDWAGRLSVERRRVARDLCRAVGGELAGLALEGARFDVRFNEAEDRTLGPEGWDEVEFFLSTNPGEELRSLARVASGGELSRIMLALKTLAAGDDRDATLIFDEVDAGIGGAVAEVVGRKLQQLGRTRQVLCITHLPVIAAFGDNHVVVTKEVEGGRTRSSARALQTAERVTELARMLAGSRLTREAQEHAEQLLRQSAEPRERRQTLTDRAGVE
jgi:DNA repair protein RecN (Recombination protein N)